MAIIETLHLDLGNDINLVTNMEFGVQNSRVFNLSGPVGPNRPNLVGDVMVIQALLSLIASVPSVGPPPQAGFDPEEMPSVTGAYDKKTESKIRIYQIWWDMRVDGVVSPGSFAGKVAGLNAFSSTITKLNLDASTASFVKLGTDDHVQTIISRYPRLIGVVMSPCF